MTTTELEANYKIPTPPPDFNSVTTQCVESSEGLNLESYIQQNPIKLAIKENVYFLWVRLHNAEPTHNLVKVPLLPCTILKSNFTSSAQINTSQYVTMHDNK